MLSSPPCLYSLDTYHRPNPQLGQSTVSLSIVRCSLGNKISPSGESLLRYKDPPNERKAPEREVTAAKYSPGSILHSVPPNPSSGILCSIPVPCLCCLSLIFSILPSYNCCDLWMVVKTAATWLCVSWAPTCTSLPLPVSGTAFGIEGLCVCMVVLVLENSFQILEENWCECFLI